MHNQYGDRLPNHREPAQTRERLQPHGVRREGCFGGGQDHGGKSNAQVALNWTICKGTLPIPGAKNEKQAQQNAGALGWKLTDDEVAKLDAASDQVLE